jgi:hypothetical protein
VRDVQHCLTCATEYVAGIEACVVCGTPLTPGPLPRDGPTGHRAAPRAAGRDSAPHFLLVQRPGLQAHHLVKALLLEDIPCLLECDGLRKTVLSGEDLAEPFAVTLPVSVYVAHHRAAEARQILASLEREDVIGDQWRESDSVETVSPVLEAVQDDARSTRPASAADHEPTRGEATSLRFAVLLAAAALVLYFFFTR